MPEHQHFDVLIVGAAISGIGAACHLRRQGDRAPWINPQNYPADKKLLREDPVEDGCLSFTKPAVAPAEPRNAEERVLQAVG